MDDSNTSNVGKIESRIPLGMSSFGKKERESFGQNIRPAMACIEGTNEPSPGKAMPADAPSISQRLKTLSQELTSFHADLLELLVRFDDLDGWKISGARHCAAWMNVELGFSTQLGWEFLRVGRRLRLLPAATALFRAGKLSWSKVRLISRVADKENEKTICHAALDASVNDVERLCCGYRWKDDGDGKDENELAVRQYESRALTWSEASNGCIRIHLVLPPEVALAFLNSVEYSLNQLEDTDNTVSQRRASASFDNVRKLSPTRYRFQVLDCEGRDIRESGNSYVKSKHAANHPASTCIQSSNSTEESPRSRDNSTHFRDDSTRVESSEPCVHYQVRVQQNIAPREYGSTFH